jgi:4a-hydroxytetrahydrobiopterin dehydratase
MKKLSRIDIDREIQKLSKWMLEEESIRRDWNFVNFTEAVKFINEVADLAEKHNHHPEIFNVYNKVTLKFFTHDAGGLTMKDFKIAAEIDKIK